MKLWILVLCIAYLLGSVPFGYLLVRFFRKEDIRTTGSGNIGATNVVRSGAKGLGVATLVLDLLKAFIAVIIAKQIAPGNSDLAAAAGVVAVMGHIFPVWLRFKGGKGVASALGVFLALSPPTAACALFVFLVIAFTTRYISLASVLGAASVPFFAWHFSHAWNIVLSFGLISFMVIVKHHSNIARLLMGTESKFGGKKEKVAT